MEFLLHGNTFDYKTFIKNLGGFWNKSYKGWIVSQTHFEEIIQEISEIAYEDKTIDKHLQDEDGNSYTLYKKKKSEEQDEDEENFLLDSDSD